MRLAAIRQPNAGPGFAGLCTARRPAGRGGRAAAVRREEVSRRVTQRRREFVHRSEEARTRRVTIRFTEDEYAALSEAAAQARMAVAAWAGQLLIAEAGDARRPLPWAADVARVENAATEARRVGVLLNQAVAALHSTGEAPDELGAAVAEARRAVAAVADAADRVAEADRGAAA